MILAVSWAWLADRPPRLLKVDRAVIEGDTGGFTQVVLDATTRVRGATIVAPRAGEMLAELTGLVARGGRLRELASVTHPYPTWGDGPWNAALAQVQAGLARPAMARALRLGVAARRHTGRRRLG